MSRMRDHNLVAMVEAVMALPDGDRVIAASCDDSGYEFATTHIYRGNCHGGRDEVVSPSKSLNAWYVVEAVHGKDIR